MLQESLCQGMREERIPLESFNAFLFKLPFLYSIVTLRKYIKSLRVSYSDALGPVLPRRSNVIKQGIMAVGMDMSLLATKFNLRTANKKTFWGSTLHALCFQNW